MGHSADDAFAFGQPPAGSAVLIGAYPMITDLHARPSPQLRHCEALSETPDHLDGRAAAGRVPAYQHLAPS
jgi:hypothetical protein